MGVLSLTEIFNDPNHANLEQHFSVFQATVRGGRPRPIGCRLQARCRGYDTIDNQRPHRPLSIQISPHLVSYSTITTTQTKLYEYSARTVQYRPPPPSHKRTQPKRTPPKTNNPKNQQCSPKLTSSASTSASAPSPSLQPNATVPVPQNQPPHPLASPRKLKKNSKPSKKPHATPSSKHLPLPLLPPPQRWLMWKKICYTQTQGAGQNRSLKGMLIRRRGRGVGRRMIR